MVKNKKNQNFKQIKLLITDVDGVLTDGGRYYSEHGEIMKRFHVRDGMGINLLLRNGVKTAILSKEKSKITKKWGKEMNVSKIVLGAIKKELELKKIMIEFRIKKNEIAYIGDDVNDIEIMKHVGLSICPNDANNQVIKIADYVCKQSGGKGAFREIADKIIIAKFPKKDKWY
jgi:3-deoxy-D-manno-octulosonate 8-phosphate phosphatase (KDO 8-P phosphatase)